MSKICIECGNPTTHYIRLCDKCYRKQYRMNNLEKRRIYNSMWRKKNPTKNKNIVMKYKRKQGILPMSENHACSMFLGVHIAERVLSRVFKDVIKQPTNNPGYDFLCNKGKKIDVKSSCLYQSKNASPRWQFHIDKNKIADYFLCLAFDNRNDLNPLYMWLFPADEVNLKNAIGVSMYMTDKWNQYSLPINKVVVCCDVMNGLYK